VILLREVLCVWWFFEIGSGEDVNGLVWIPRGLPSPGKFVRAAVRAHRLKKRIYCRDVINQKQNQTKNTVFILLRCVLLRAPPYRLPGWKCALGRITRCFRTIENRSYRRTRVTTAVYAYRLKTKSRNAGRRTKRFPNLIYYTFPFDSFPSGGTRTYKTYIRTRFDNSCLTVSTRTRRDPWSIHGRRAHDKRIFPLQTRAVQDCGIFYWPPLETYREHIISTCIQ